MKVNSEFGEVIVEGVSKTFDRETVLAKIDLKVGCEVETYYSIVWALERHLYSDGSPRKLFSQP